MDAVIVRVADAITSGITGAVFSPPYADVEAERTYEPYYNIEKMSELAIFVVPKTRAFSVLGRSVAENDIQVDIGVQKKIARGATAEADELMFLAEEIMAFIHMTKHFAECRVVRNENALVYSQEKLENFGVIGSVITVTLLGEG